MHPVSGVSSGPSYRGRCRPPPSGRCSLEPCSDLKLPQPSPCFVSGRSRTKYAGSTEVFVSQDRRKGTRLFFFFLIIIYFYSTSGLVWIHKLWPWVASRPWAEHLALFDFPDKDTRRDRWPHRTMAPWSGEIVKSHIWPISTKMVCCPAARLPGCPRLVCLDVK